MATNSISIRISAINKYMIEHYISENFLEEYPTADNATINELITFLIRKNLGLFYPKLKSETQNAINTKRVNK